jgi:hypothetical protein
MQVEVITTKSILAIIIKMCTIDISRVIGRDYSVLRLYKGFGQRIINLWRCLISNPL